MSLAHTPFIIPPGGGKVVSIIGEDKVNFKAYTQETNGQYSLMYQTVPPKHGPRKHVHTFEDEAFYVLDGEFSFEVGDQFFKGTPGTFIFGPRGIPHKFWNSGEKAANFLIILSPARGLELFFEEFAQLLHENPSDFEKQAVLAEKYGIFFVEN